MATPTGMQGFVTLWAGEDPAFRDNLLEALQSAGIAFVDRSIGTDKDTSTTDPFFVGQNPMFGFQVAVQSSSVAAAEQILERLLEQEPENVELPESDSSAPAPQIRASSPAGGTTCAVWSGNDKSQADFLVQALKENEIPVRLASAVDQLTVYVPPAEETLAREIIREILEGAPPA